MGMSLLIFVAAETGASEPLPSKMTLLVLLFWLLSSVYHSRCLENGHIPSQYIEMDHQIT
jgi:hypothetical protein